MLRRDLETGPSLRFGRNGLCVALLGATALVSGCTRSSNLPAGPAAYAIFPSAQAVAPTENYTLGPSDTISVAVFNEPELSTQGLKIDTSGNVNLPLIGRMKAAGKTTDGFAREIEDRLRSGGFLVSPRTTVNLVEAVSQKVTVEGEVNQPGVYQITGPTTLLDALAMSRGTTRIAKLREVAIFRTVNGEQLAAKFDLGAIRRGEQPNPALQGNDIVVVGFNGLAAAWRDFLQAAPAFTAFSRPFF